MYIMLIANISSTLQEFDFKLMIIATCHDVCKTPILIVGDIDGLVVSGELN